MSLPVRVVKLDGEMAFDPYLLRLAGWTEDRYFKEAPETQIVEFEDGELIVHSPANIKHQRLVRFLTFLLHGYVSSRNLGEVLNGPAVVRLRPGLNYEPDIFVVGTEQRGQIEEQRFSGAPLLVVEMISPSTRNYDLRTKAMNYREHGVPEYWAVDPAQQTVDQHLLPQNASAPYVVAQHTQGRLESRAIAGLWIDVSWLWQEPLPGELPCLEQMGVFPR